MAEKLSVLSRLGSPFNRCNFPSLCLKPLQVIKYFEYLLNGKGIVAVLPTGFGKSLLFQLLSVSCLSPALPAYQHRKEITLSNENSTHISNLRGKIFVTASFSSTTKYPKQVAALECIAAKPANWSSRMNSINVNTSELLNLLLFSATMAESQLSWRSTREPSPFSSK